jgi:hypothetical protein
MEAFLRARDFEESDDTHFGEWLKKQDAAANTEREKRAEELMEAQKVSHDDSWEAA